MTNGTTITITDYLTGFQYTGGTMAFFPHAEGYVNVRTGPAYNYVFNYTDHLGNVRVSYAKDAVTNVLRIMEENHYYAFGLKHTNYNTDVFEIAELGTIKTKVNTLTNAGYKYKYNGKELQDELGLNMYDYGARNYDAALGRWMNIDPLAEKYRRWTPYNYAMNNPVFFIDPDGMQVTSGGDPKKTLYIALPKTSKIEFDTGVVSLIRKEIPKLDAKYLGDWLIEEGRSVNQSENKQIPEQVVESAANNGGQASDATIFDDTYTPDDVIEINIETKYDKNSIEFVRESNRSESYENNSNNNSEKKETSNVKGSLEVSSGGKIKGVDANATIDGSKTWEDTRANSNTNTTKTSQNATMYIYNVNVRVDISVSVDGNTSQKYYYQKAVIYSPQKL